MDNEAARIVYDAAVRASQDQASVLDSIRTRAGTLLAAAALVSSFLGGQALRSESSFAVASMSGLAVAAFVIAAILTLAILWPFEFRFGLQASSMIEGLDRHSGQVGEFYRVLAVQLEWRYLENLGKIRRLQWAFEVAIVCLVAEVGLWIAVLWRA